MGPRSQPFLSNHLLHHVTPILTIQIYYKSIQPLTSCWLHPSTTISCTCWTRHHLTQPWPASPLPDQRATPCSPPDPHPEGCTTHGQQIQPIWCFRPTKVEIVGSTRCYKWWFSHVQPQNWGNTRKQPDTKLCAAHACLQTLKNLLQRFLQPKWCAQQHVLLKARVEGNSATSDRKMCITNAFNFKSAATWRIWLIPHRFQAQQVPSASPKETGWDEAWQRQAHANHANCIYFNPPASNSNPLSYSHPSQLILWKKLILTLMSIYFYPCPAINPAILLPFIQFPESTSTQVLTGRVRCPGNKKLGTPESFPHQPLCAREEQEQQILPSSKLTCTLPDRG